MTALSSSFFRFIACLARLPDGQQAIQVFGILRRAVERLDMGAYTPQDVATRTELAMLLARMANKHSVEFGSTNDLLLGAKQRVLPRLVEMLDPRCVREK